MFGILRGLLSGTGLLALLVTISVTGKATPSSAHSFVVEIHAVGEDRAVILMSAVQGFLIATEERDGHADQASDGHLGGLDVYILPKPVEAATDIVGLKPAPYDLADISVVIGAPEQAAILRAETGEDAVAMPPGTLPPEQVWLGAGDATAKGFAARYRATYGVPPDRWAAEGYDAARRIDLAVRPLGGLEHRAALARALMSSVGGISW